MSNQNLWYTVNNKNNKKEFLMSFHSVKLTYAGGTIDRQYQVKILDTNFVDELDDQLLFIMQFDPFARLIDTLREIDREFIVSLVLHEEFRDALMSISVSSLADRSGASQDQFDACVAAFQEKFAPGNQYAYYFEP